MSYQLTEPAERDVRSILAATLTMFGTHQLDRYAGIISRGLAMVGDDPDRPGSLDRSEIADGVRLFHLDHAAGRRGAAAHCVYYVRGRMGNGRQGVLILRLLHERMEPRRKVLRAIGPRR